MSQYKWEDGGDASDLSENKLEDGGDASDVYPLDTGNETQAAMPTTTEPSTDAVAAGLKDEEANKSSTGSNGGVTTEPVADLLGPEAEAPSSSKKKKSKGVIGTLKKLALPGSNKTDN